MSTNSKLNGANNRQFLFIELFVALSLSVAYYFLVQYFAVGSPNDSTNRWVFTSCSIPGFHLQQLGDVWKGRLSGLLLSGWLFDFLVKDNTFDYGQYSRLFALYQSFWLFLLLLAVILTLRYSLFINFGIFAGLIYNFSPASGLYFYPWDIPATLFFTLAVLFFERRQMALMAAAVCVGCFFKETVLACAVLALFASHWKWWKRALLFAGMVAVYVAGKKFLLGQLDLPVAAFSMGNATNLAGLVRPTILVENFKKLFTPTFNHTIFANAGTLAAVLVLGWRRRFLPYMAIIVVFLGGQFMYGGFNEFRIFMQILPLSLLLLSERWQEYAGSGAAEKQSAGPTPAWTVRKTFPILVPATIVLIGMSSGIAAWRYYNLFENLRPDRQAQSEIGKHAIEPKGEVNNLAVDCQLLREKYGGAELELAMLSVANQQLSDAIEHCRRALELNTNSIPALNDLAWLLATASNPQLRNGKEAVLLAERACQLTQYKEAYPIGTLAAAYAEAGRFDDAVATTKKFRTVALAHGQDEIVAKNEQLLELLESGRAFHQELQRIVSDPELLRAGYAGAELELARVSLDNQQLSDAIEHYQRVLELDTNSIPALNDLALLRATASDPQLRNGKEAVLLAERACQLTQYKMPFLVGTLAAAYAETGRFNEAIATAEKASTLALAQGQKEIAAKNEQLLELYKTGRAYHQEAKPAP
jgi:tetratricopeptide (TPR) repeat protein